jgi:hypothetical protein
MLRSFNRSSSRALLTFLALTLATLPVPLSSQDRLALGLASLFGSTGPIVLAGLERRLNASAEENERERERLQSGVHVVQVLDQPTQTPAAPLAVPAFLEKDRSSQPVQVRSSQPNLNGLERAIEHDPWDEPPVQVPTAPVQPTLDNWMHIQ